MRVNEIKHQASLEKWKQNILDCRMSGLTVQQWCSEYGCNKATYYRWEREIFKKTDTLVPATESTNAAVTLSGQPEFVELPIAASGPLALQEAIRPSRFESVAIIRVGKGTGYLPFTSFSLTDAGTMPYTYDVKNGCLPYPEGYVYGGYTTL